MALAMLGEKKPTQLLTLAPNFKCKSHLCIRKITKNKLNWVANLGSNSISNMQQVTWNNKAVDFNLVRPVRWEIHAVLQTCSTKYFFYVLQHYNAILI